jgi:predicted transcriptional regulator
MEALRFSPKTSKEIAEFLNRPLNAISGRLSELKAIGKIEKTGQRRDGAAELRAI